MSTDDDDADDRRSDNYYGYERGFTLGVSKSAYEKVEFAQRKPSRNFMERFKQTFPSYDMNAIPFTIIARAKKGRQALGLSGGFLTFSAKMG